LAGARGCRRPRAEKGHGAQHDYCFVFVEGHVVVEAPAPSSSVKPWEGARGCVELGRGMGRSGRWPRVEDGGRFMGIAWWTG